MIAKLPVVVLSILCFLQTPSYLQSTRLQSRCEKDLIVAQQSLETCKTGLRSCACAKDIAHACEGRVKACESSVKAYESKVQAYESKVQAYESTIRGLNDDIKRLKDLGAARPVEKDFKPLYEATIIERDKLKDRNTVLESTVDGFRSRLGSESSKYADLLEQAKKSKIEAPDVGPTENPAIVSPAAAETYRTLLATDDVAAKTSNNKPVEYTTVIDGGKTYQLRELMIGTLLFPDPSTLEVEPAKPLNIEVKFRPNALLKNSSLDEKTNWFLEFNFAPDRIKDFAYDDIGSKGNLKRLVGDEGEETWIWKIDKMPDNFSTDTPRVQIDGSVEIDGQEVVKKKIENNPLVIKEKPVPSFFAAIFRKIMEYSTMILLFSTAAFGVGTAYFGLRKAKIENKMKEAEARNSELERQITEAGETE